MASLTTDTPTSQTAGVASGPQRDQRRLEWAAGFFAMSVLVHNGDHLRRGAEALHADVFWSGVLALLVETALVILVFARHRLAPLATALGGFGLAVGYLVVHFTPRRAWLSDSLLSGHQLASIAAASLETISATALAIAGAGIVLRRGSPRSRPLGNSGGGSVRWRRGWLHPAALAVVAGNGVILLASLLQRAR